jgi:diguanylate cyclase (GGDEF)-like protein
MTSLPPTATSSRETFEMVYRLKRRVRNLEWFLKLAFELNRTLDRTETVSIINQFFKKNLMLDGFSLWLTAPNSKKLELTANYGLAVAQYLTPLLQGKGKAPLKLSQDPDKYHYIEDIAAGNNTSLHGSVLIVPLCPEKGSMLGFIALFRQRTAAFSVTEVALLRETSRFITLHLRKISLFHNTRELAYVDGLTQVFNRRYFDQRYIKEIGRAQRYKRSLSLLMIDIDHFKKYNDMLGHVAGDEAIRMVASQLEKSLRKADVVCRYGGEEFVVLLPEIGSASALKVAEKLRKAILTVQFAGEEKLPEKHLTISIGVAAFPEHGESAEEMLKNADKALYRAKESGRNRVLMAEKAAPAAP